MRSTIHPATHANPMGFVETTLLLPAHWAFPLLHGDYLNIEDMEACVIDHIEMLFGRCTDASDNIAFAHTHDASADGIPSADCCEFTFVNHTEE